MELRLLGFLGAPHGNITMQGEVAPGLSPAPPPHSILHCEGCPLSPHPSSVLAPVDLGAPTPVARAALGCTDPGRGLEAAVCAKDSGFLGPWTVV